MKSVLLALLIATPAVAADGFTTVKDFQPDFEKAVQCRPLDGRKVWKGHTAYYIQSTMFYTDQSGALDPESADTVAIKTAPAKSLAVFKKVCS